jgi:two-component system OmpR family response regulator
MTILLVEDDDNLTIGLRRGLERNGFVVDIAADGAIGLERAVALRYDLVVLDIMLPSMNGFKICAELRRRSVWIPILMLTAKSGEWDQAESLDAGADDYLVKPVSMLVFLAHVRALLRRSQVFDTRCLTSAGLTLDPIRHCCSDGHSEVQLSGKEVEVLAFLMARSGVVSKMELIAGVWGHDFPGDPNIAEVYVRHLRRKLEGPFGRRIIETVRGVGYRLSDRPSG